MTAPTEILPLLSISQVSYLTFVTIKHKEGEGSWGRNVSLISDPYYAKMSRQTKDQSVRLWLFCSFCLPGLLTPRQNDRMTVTQGVLQSSSPEQGHGGCTWCLYLMDTRSLSMLNALFVSFQTLISSHRHELAFKCAFYTKHCFNDDKNSILADLTGLGMRRCKLGIYLLLGKPFIYGIVTKPAAVLI